LVVNRKRHDWRPGQAISAATSDKADWPKPEKQKGNLQPWHMVAVVVIIGAVMLLVRRFSTSEE